MGNIYAERVELLRQQMRHNHWDAVIISGADPHASEYVADRWQQIAWISGFTGESGTVVVTDSHAGLWTDTRYFIQAGKQLPGTGFELHKTNVPDEILVPDWLAKCINLDCPIVIAIDGLCQTISAVHDISKAFDKAGKPEPIIESISDLLEPLWHDRPAIPDTPVTMLGTEYTGSPQTEKMAWLRDEIKRQGCDAILLTALDEIAWLLNIRGNDIAYNPVVISYLIVTMTEIKWFVQKSDNPDSVTSHTFAELIKDGVQIYKYNDILDILPSLKYNQLYYDASTLNYTIYKLLCKTNESPEHVKVGVSPIILKKSIKNEVEISCMRKAHVVDGVAVVRFLHWLEKSIQAGQKVSEWDAAVQLGKYRALCPEYRGDSFETISAWEKGAALPHYITPKDGSTLIGNHGLYLCDSGGQYLFGTTDITRTVPVGPCTEIEKEDYTLVLQGHIRLALCHFPHGTSGVLIDVLARDSMWRKHRNFGHGTGHGVGFYLNVHEGPQGIRQGYKNQPILPGMITSNEPGLYRENNYGIRHENLILCVDTGDRSFDYEWLRFETITMCYFDTAPIKPGILLQEEIQWLNDYNETVYQTLLPYLDSETSEWLRHKTLPVSI